MVFTFEQVHNYYERLVFEEVARRAESNPDFTVDMLCDVACVALNRLPARYVRHDVDLMFYLTEHERHAIDLSLEEVRIVVLHGRVFGVQRVVLLHADAARGERQGGGEEHGSHGDLGGARGASPISRK